jgi:hypothetical protein
LQELTEEEWNKHVSRLVNLGMVPYNRKDLEKLVNFRFNLNGNNEVREDEKKFKIQYMPVKRNITCNFKDSHLQIHKHARSTSSTLFFPSPNGQYLQLQS